MSQFEVPEAIICSPFEEPAQVIDFRGSELLVVKPLA